MSDERVAARFVDNWMALDPKLFLGCDRDAILAEVLKACEWGGIEGIARLMEVPVREVEDIIFS